MGAMMSKGEKGKQPSQAWNRVLGRAWNRIGSRIFTKVFLYTLTFLAVAITVAALVFAQQFRSFYDSSRIQQLSFSFGPLVDLLQGKDRGEIAVAAEEFHEKNQSFSFSVETLEGEALYRTFSFDDDVIERDFIRRPAHYERMEERVRLSRPAPMDGVMQGGMQGDMQGGMQGAMQGGRVAASFFVADIGMLSHNAGGEETAMYIMTLAQPDVRLRVMQPVTDSAAVDSLMYKIVLAASIMLVACVAGALLFARGITNPIKRLAADTRKMANLEPVALPAQRMDEVGQLTSDVHNMYEKLKTTISELEREIALEREMEENQRYFFSAASHELKTPIAATSAVLEGMIAGIGEYRDHPRYLRECLNMMTAQGRIISEILEIVKLSGNNMFLNVQPIKLSNAVNSMMAEYRVLANKKGQAIMVDIPEDAVCLTDVAMLRRALSNIIMNAIQNSPDGGEIRIWSESSSRGNGDSICEGDSAGAGTGKMDDGAEGDSAGAGTGKMDDGAEGDSADAGRGKGDGICEGDNEDASTGKMEDGTEGDSAGVSRGKGNVMCEGDGADVSSGNGYGTCKGDNEAASTGKMDDGAEGNSRGVICLNILNTDSNIVGADWEKVFEPFYRADKARSRSVGRSGLGLAIVKKILDSLKVPFSLSNVGSDVIFKMELKT